MPIKFSSDLAFRLADPSSFHKGERYFEDGVVGKIQREGQVYTSAVEGTRRYSVSIIVESEDNIRATCTCPYEGEGICKHAVATILALAADKELATVVAVQSGKEKQEQRAEKLLARASDAQARKFLKHALLSNAQMVRDFAIFLQGPKETSATAQSYQAKIMKQLDELDLEELEQVWLSSGEDNYDYYPNYRDDNGYSEETLAKILHPFRQEAQKYADNKNFAESGKIFQAISEALRDKNKEITDKYPDLGDWFLDEINETIKLYCGVLAALDEAGIKRAGLEYLCLLFEQKQFDWSRKELAEGLQVAATKKSDAAVCLRQLSNTIAKPDLSDDESSLLASLYLLAGEETEFEKFSLKNCIGNPSLTLELLKYYKYHNRKPDLLKIADRVLGHLSKTDSFWDFSDTDVEIEIREFLKTIFDPRTEYAQRISNLETLFLKSTKLSDYKELATAYRSPTEKEKILAKMKAEFARRHEIEIMFKVFKLEDKKREILALTDKYKDEHCFPDMVAFISTTYPQESFSNYQAKIKHLLKETNVKYYPQVAYHLKQMKRIGLSENFEKFVEWVVVSYKRRYRLIEELQKGGLISG